MKHLLTHTLAALTLLAANIGAHAQTVIADWQFSDASLTTLNNTANSGSGLNGPGSSWSVGITGLATNGAGLLDIGNDGRGGSGTRSAYADFGPDFDMVSSGTLSLFAHFAAWQLPQTGNTPSFTLGFIEGNSFSTAQFSLAASANGLTLAGGVDEDSNGMALAQSTNFAGFQPLTVRLDVNLDLQDYRLAFDTGSGFVSVGSAAIDSFTAGINSLRLGLNGDFSASGLALDRIWVMETPSAAVPEAGNLAMILAGILLIGWITRRQRGA